MGDYVLAYDEASAAVGFCPVTAVWAHDDPVILLLTIDGEVVETTAEHPFYTDDGAWVAAGELEAGDRIYEADGDFGTVESAAVVYLLQPMYNLTVASAHTYFVGDEQWLVHNDCWKIAGTRGLDHSFDNHAKEWFGREVPRSTHLSEWQRIIEQAAKSKKIFDWDVRGKPTVAHLARIEDKYFVVQFYKEGAYAGELATAFVPKQHQLTSMLRKLGK